MRKSIVSLVIAGFVVGLGVSPVRGQDKATRERLDQRAHEVNILAKRPGMTKTALHAVSVETGVPEANLEAMHKRHPDAGAAGILIACVLADETKKKPGDFL